jgi:general stress protein YciG
MAGTVAGGKAAAATNKSRYGKDFYSDIGREGGKISRGGGFASDRDLAVEAGRKGGTISRRTKVQRERSTNE